VSQAPHPPSDQPPGAAGAPNWSADEPEEPQRSQLSSPPAGRVWDPGSPPGYETPGYQPITEVPPAASYPPPLGLQVVPAAPTNGMAIASLVCGVLGWVMFPVVAPILAVIFGHIARGQIRQTGEGGGGMALAGLLLGYINLALCLLALLVGIVVILIALAATHASGG
jgi:hypothetical protein